MKNKFKNILTLISIVVAVIILVRITTRCDKRPHNNFKDTIYLQDTLYLDSIVFDTIYLDKYITKTLKLHDTLFLDSIILDSVEVEVPIQNYHLDTLIDEAHLKAHLKGFDVEVVQLYLNYPKAVVTPQKQPKKKRFGLGLQVGVGLGENSGTLFCTPYLGLGIQYNIFSF